MRDLFDDDNLPKFDEEIVKFWKVIVVE
jgi:hypothetical protein